MNDLGNTELIPRDQAVNIKVKPALMSQNSIIYVRESQDDLQAKALLVLGYFL
jgi:hypothetical protein